MKNGSCDSQQVQKRLCLCAVHFLKWADVCGFHGLVVAVSWVLLLNVFIKTEERVCTKTKGKTLYFSMQWCVLSKEGWRHFIFSYVTEQGALSSLDEKVYAKPW